MSSQKKTILGEGLPMPLLSVTMPRYTVAKLRRDGGTAFYFQVPKRLRPEGWAGGYRLPSDPARRTGKADAAEIAAVVADAEAFLIRLEAERSGIPLTVRHGTLPWLIAAYEQSDKFKRRADKTKRTYQYAARVVTAFSAQAGHPLVAKINQPALIKILSTMDAQPRKRNQIASYLSIILSFAVRKGVRSDNPAMKLDLEAAPRRKKVHIWSDEDLADKMLAARVNGRASVALAMLIAHDQGFRPTDTLRLQKGRDYDTKTGRFKFRCSKTGEWAECDATMRVRAAIEATPAEQLVLVVNEETGKVYNERVFNRHFNIARGDATHLWFRELRHTHVVKARRAGLTSDEIAGRTAHSPRSVDKILEEFYSPHDTEVIQRGAAKFEAYINRPIEQKSDVAVGCQLDAKA